MNFQLEEVSLFTDPTKLGGFMQVNKFKIAKQTASLSDLFATNIFDGRYMLPTRERIMKAMAEKGKNEEEPWPRMSFQRSGLAEDKFKIMTRGELEETLREYAKEPDWGEDLPFYLETVKRTMEILTSASQGSTMLYINKDDADRSDIVEFEPYGYAIIILLFDKVKSVLTMIDLGED